MIIMIPMISILSNSYLAASTTLSLGTCRDISSILFNSLATNIRNYCADTELLNYLAVNVTFEPVQFDRESERCILIIRTPFDDQNNSNSQKNSLESVKYFSLDLDGDSLGR